jgi:hypothetical protein
MLDDSFEVKKPKVDVTSFNCYNEYAAAKVEEMSDFVVALLQYDDAYDALQIAQISWITEFYKKRKRKGS